MTLRLWVCPVTTLFMSRTQGTMENTTGAVLWWTHTQPSPCRQGPCPTTTGKTIITFYCNIDFDHILIQSNEDFLTIALKYHSSLVLIIVCSMLNQALSIELFTVKSVYKLNCTIFHLRAQQLLLVRLRKMALEQKDFKKKVIRLLKFEMALTGGSISVTLQDQTIPQLKT